MFSVKETAINNSRINLNELAFDAALLIFPLLLGRYYDELMSFRPFGVPFVKLFLTGAIYFLPLLIGKMYHADFKDSSERVKKCVLVIFWTTLCFAYANLLYLVIPTIKKAGSYGNYIMVTATLFLIMGPIAGLAFTRKNAPRVKGASTQIILFLVTIGFLPLFYMIIGGEEIFGNSGFLPGILIFFALIFGDAVFILLIYAAYAAGKKMIIKAGVYDAGLFIIRILTPFCVSFLLVLFYINSDRLFMTGIGTGSAASILLIILLYMASGVLPLRIMMMLAPPVRPINILIGVASMIAMIAATALS